ncbi:MAG: PAS domain S-box protein [Anaerolineales bacterium]|nr:PAS domain S-box protein [Anaerolineales bacterium]
MFIENFSIVILLLLGCSNLAIWGTLLMRKQKSIHQHHTAIFIIGAGLYVLAYFFLVISGNLWLKIALLKFQYLLLLVIASAWLGYMYQQTHPGQQYSRRLMFVVFMLIAIAAGFILTNEWHQLIWRNISLRPMWTRETIQFEHGIGFWVLVGACLLSISVGMFWSLGLKGQIDRQFRQWQSLLNFAYVLPVVCAVVDYFWGAGIWVVPYGVGISGFILGVAGIWKFSIDILPVAHELIIEGMDDGVIVLNMRGEVLELNLRAEEILSTSIDKAYGKPLSELPVLQEMGKDQEKASSWMSRTSELAFKLNGETHYFDLRSSSLRSDGVEVGRVLVMRDISDHKEITNALRESEESYRSLFERVPVGLYRTRPDSKILDVNQALVEILGFPNKETLLRARTGDQYADPKGHEEWMRLITAEGKLQDYENHLKRYDGSEIWLRENAIAIRNERGEIESFEGSLEDITGTKLTMLALEQERNFIETVLNTVGALVLVMDRKGRIIRFNRACERLTGYSHADLADLDLISALIPAAEQKEINAVFQKLLQGVLIRHHENHWKTRSGMERLISWSNALLHGEDGSVEYIVSAGIDITDQREAEKGLEIYADELERSNSELENFAYIASHDLQEPLRMIASYLQLLQRRYGDRLDGDAEEFIEFAVDGARRMQGLIHGLLEYSRVGTRGGEFVRLDVRRVVDQSLQNISILLDEVDGEVLIEALPEIHADETQFVQLFQNLIGNALKFRREEPPTIHISASKDDGAWIFSVRDNGIGIAPKFQDRIFKIFQRLHTQQEYAGTGIGLAVCKRIVERHNGKIWVESTPGSGSTFRFSIPADLDAKGDCISPIAGK